MVFSGHIHQAPFVKDGSWTDRIGQTWVFNSGQQIGPTPTHVIVDTDARQAIWMSITGAETVHLDQPLQRVRLHQLPQWLESKTGLKNRDRDPSPAQNADAAG